MNLAAKVRAKRDLPPPEVRRALRIAAGVSQKDIGAELGVTRAAVSRWESGDRVPRDETLQGYVKILRSLQGRL
jgi:transcriptional regulator with XRE-family HTH domain